MIGLNWENVWSEGGRLRFHSIDRELLWVDIIYRSEENDSQIKKMKMRTATIEICLPMEETMFHDRKASG